MSMKTSTMPCTRTEIPLCPCPASDDGRYASYKTMDAAIDIKDCELPNVVRYK